MTTHRRPHVLPVAAFAAVSSTLLGIGCASGSGSDASDKSSQAVASDEVALDGVRIDVRRDPG
jgi:hypothetical protein